MSTDTLKELQRRNPKARYSHIWNPSEVLLNKQLGKNGSLSLKALSEKLSVLLALTTAQRVQA